MNYEINISLKGRHFFATAPRSITSESELLKVYRVLSYKFPESEGYSLSATFWKNIGEQLNIAELAEKAIKQEA